LEDKSIKLIIILFVIINEEENTVYNWNCNFVLNLNLFFSLYLNVLFISIMSGKENGRYSGNEAR